ncbi:MAG TPA: helix-turn-helix transcriptional regulator [Solirubrobacteraceae bacterium]|nr:helix-turn-helix transcriptional regulator [Solirubrobacteraceae bacterium]
MRPATIEQRRRLYLLARVVIARHYRRPLTLDEVARALSSSPRQLTRAYAQFGETTFREDLLTRRLKVAAQLLIEQPAISVRDVARLVGFRQAPHFAKAFRRRYGLTPAAFRAEGRAFARAAQDAPQRRPTSARCVSNAPRAVRYRPPAATRPVPLPVGAEASACHLRVRSGR